MPSVYQALVLEHYRRPRTRGPLEGATASGFRRNATCGDEVQVRIRVAEGRIAEARFEGEGCSISQASASMLMEGVEGRTAAEARNLGDRFTAMLQGDPAAALDPELGDLRALAGVAGYPVRVRCALLPLEALYLALDDGAGPTQHPEEEGP
jgi:nitrogen fixation protein NifU and related proteins